MKSTRTKLRRLHQEIQAIQLQLKTLSQNTAQTIEFQNWVFQRLLDAMTKIEAWNQSLDEAQKKSK